MVVTHHFVFKLVESHHMADVHHMVEVHHMVKIHYMVKVTIIFDVIALELACRPVRVQTGEWNVVLRKGLE